MFKNITLGALITACSVITVEAQQQTANVKGTIQNHFKEVLGNAHILVQELKLSVSADYQGKYLINALKPGKYTLSITAPGYKSEIHKIQVFNEDIALNIALSTLATDMEEVEVFGERQKAPEKLDMITRLPLKPSEQLQSISVISSKIIAEQGALSLTDATRNVTGITLFGSYGGVKESMSTRGYRGVPVLKNGVRMDSDFRTGSGFFDMQGVENIQVIKGSAAITQGIGNDLGAAGGVINVVTKTPKFYNGGEVGLRVGSWGQVRPTIDVQAVLDEKNKVAVRMNGAFERADSYRPHMGKESFYINPSLEWRPNNKTRFVAELDHYNNSSTPDRGTVNLGPDSVEALLDLPFEKFLGFENDQALTKNTSITFRGERTLSDNLSLRAAYFSSNYFNDNVGVGTLSTFKKDGVTNYNLRSRSLTRSTRSDINSGFQLDLVGKNLQTGKIKHTFQVGMDFRNNKLATTAYGAIAVDTIDVLGTISNQLPDSISAKNMVAQTPVTEASYTYGFTAQDYISVNKYLTLVAGVRYSMINGITGMGTGKNTADNIDPMFGFLVSPINNVNFFGSYTTTTSLRSANNIQLDRVTPVGASRSRQFEAGWKSEWLNNKLRFNFTYFNIDNTNLTYAEYDESGTATGYYGLAGNLKRTGIETEVAGSITQDLQVLVGYAYLNARYEQSPAYVEGSAPSNAPAHTANAWANYKFSEGAFKGFSVGVGCYYVGERPVNEYTQKVVIHNTTPGVKPFDMPSYTTLNVQLGYTYKNITTRVFLNNLTDAIGYNSYYRGGYINRIDPRNIAVGLNYRF